MGGQTWLIDGSIIATKIKNASGTEPESCDLSRENRLQSNPTRDCPRCSYIIDNNNVSQKWPGLPKGVRFDPTDSELLLHLLAKSGKCGANPHPFINEFITTIEECDGICYTHPQRLPGVKQDGSASHFFHRTLRAYNTGTRKRRKIHNGDHLGDVRWHKTGKTKPVIVDGTQLGCKKIMVLYLIVTKGGKAEKTNWVMHQYHLGTEEDETNEYVVSKVFCQQPPQSRQNDINKLDPVTANRLKLEKLNCPATEKRHQRLDSKYTADVASSDRELKTLGAETVYDVENFDVCTDNVTLDDIHADNIHLGNLSIVDDGKNRHVDENNHSQVAESIDDVENYDVCTDNVSLDDIHADNIHLGNSSIVNDGENRHIDENNLFQVAETIKDVKNYNVCTDDVALDDIHAVDIDENRHVGDNADGCEDNSHSQEFSPFDSKNIWDTEELAVAGEDLFNSQPFLAYYARLGGAEHLRSDLEECKRLNSIDKLSSECRLKGDQEECKRLICIDDQEDIVLDAPHSDLICIGDNKPPSDCQKIDSDLEEFKRLICIDNQDFAPSDKEMRLSQLVFSSDDSVLGW